jgi:hypothetical protein
MGTRSLLRSSLSALALIAATPAFPSASHAITFNLTEDHCTGGWGIPPFGSLFGTNAFVKTGSVDFQAFKFNASGVVVGTSPRWRMKLRMACLSSIARARSTCIDHRRSSSLGARFSNPQLGDAEWCQLTSAPFAIEFAVNPKND